MSFIQEIAKELLGVGLIERCPRNASGIPGRLMPVDSAAIAEDLA